LAGYSGTPLPKKLGIKDGTRLGLFGAPADFDETLGTLPAGVTTSVRATGSLDVAVLFVTRAGDLKKRFEAAARTIAPAGALWIAWPKKSSGQTSDLDDKVVRAIGLAEGLVDVKVCAIDDRWSGLKFVVRVRDRPRRA
jgi:hypothetical protein